MKRTIGEIISRPIGDILDEISGDSLGQGFDITDFWIGDCPRKVILEIQCSEKTKKEKENERRFF